MHPETASEPLTLAANGYGVGALKILRSMYEHVVTATFIAKNPSEWEAFANDSATKQHKIWKRTVEWSPEIAERYDSAQQDWLERACAEAVSGTRASIVNQKPTRGRDTTGALHEQPREQVRDRNSIWQRPMVP